MSVCSHTAGYSFGGFDDSIGGGTYSTPIPYSTCMTGGGKRGKKKKTRGKKKRKPTLRRGASTFKKQRKKKRKPTFRKGSSTFKKQKKRHSKREVVKSIMKGLGEKRKTLGNKRKMKGGRPSQTQTAPLFDQGQLGAQQAKYLSVWFDFHRLKRGFKICYNGGRVLIVVNDSRDWIVNAENSSNDKYLVELAGEIINARAGAKETDAAHRIKVEWDIIEKQEQEKVEGEVEKEETILLKEYMRSGLSSLLRKRGKENEKILGLEKIMAESAGKEMLDILGLPDDYKTLRRDLNWVRFGSLYRAFRADKRIMDSEKSKEKWRSWVSELARSSSIPEDDMNHLKNVVIFLLPTFNQAMEKIRRQKKGGSTPTFGKDSAVTTIDRLVVYKWHIDALKKDLQGWLVERHVEDFLRAKEEDFLRAKEKEKDEPGLVGQIILDIREAWVVPRAQEGWWFWLLNRNPHLGVEITRADVWGQVRLQRIQGSFQRQWDLWRYSKSGIQVEVGDVDTQSRNLGIGPDKEIQMYTIIWDVDDLEKHEAPFRYSDLRSWGNSLEATTSGETVPKAPSKHVQVFGKKDQSLPSTRADELAKWLNELRLAKFGPQIIKLLCKNEAEADSTPPEPEPEAEAALIAERERVAAAARAQAQAQALAPPEPGAESEQARQKAELPKLGLDKSWPLAPEEAALQEQAR